MLMQLFNVVYSVSFSSTLPDLLLCATHLLRLLLRSLKLLVEFLDLLRCTICVYGVLPLAQNVTDLGQCVSVHVLSCIIYMNQ